MRGEAPTKSSSPPARRFDGALDHEEKPVRFERFLNEIVSAHLDGGDGGLDRAMATDHQHRQIGQLASYDLQDLEAVELTSLQPDVEHKQRG